MVLAYQQLLPMRYPAPSKKPQRCKQVLFSICGIEAPTDIFIVMPNRLLLNWIFGTNLFKKRMAMPNQHCPVLPVD